LDVVPTDALPPGYGEARTPSMESVAARLRSFGAAVARADGLADARNLTQKEAIAEAKEAAAKEAAEAATKAAAEGAANEDEDEAMGSPPPPPPPLQPTYAAPTLSMSQSILALAEEATGVTALPAAHGPHLSLLRVALLEFEERLRSAGAAWAVCTQHAAAMRELWLGVLSQATHPIELGAALRTLEGLLAPTARSRALTLERCYKWRHGVLKARTVSAVARHLYVLDETCAWDALEKELAKAAGAVTGKADRPRAVRPRMGPLAYAAHCGDKQCGWLRLCEVSPLSTAVRASVQIGAVSRLYTLIPSTHPAGEPTAGAPAGWQWMPVGILNEGSPVELRGLTVAEAKSARLTVWYEETHPDKYTGVEKPMDVPYSGVVLGVHYAKGLSVRFEHTVDEATGKAETIHISNEDDWIWGMRRTKTASWSLEDPNFDKSLLPQVVARLIDTIPVAD
jgi:hypothetical protein